MSGWDDATRLPVHDQPVTFLAGARSNILGADEYRVLNVPRAAVYRLAGHNIATGGAAVPIQMDTIEYDTDGMVDLSSALSASRLTCQTTGLYAFSGEILWPAPAAVTFRQILTLKTTAAGIAFWNNGIQYPNITGAHSQLLSGHVSLQKGDYFELAAAQNTGGVIALLGNTFSIRDISMQICLISTL